MPTFSVSFWNWKLLPWLLVISYPERTNLTTSGTQMKTFYNKFTFLTLHAVGIICNFNFIHSYEEKMVLQLSFKEKPRVIGSHRITKIPKMSTAPTKFQICYTESVLAQYGGTFLILQFSKSFQEVHNRGSLQKLQKLFKEI